MALSAAACAVRRCHGMLQPGYQTFFAPLAIEFNSSDATPSPAYHVVGRRQVAQPCKSRRRGRQCHRLQHQRPCRGCWPALHCRPCCWDGGCACNRGRRCPGCPRRRRRFSDAAGGGDARFTLQLQGTRARHHIRRQRRRGGPLRWRLEPPATPSSTVIGTPDGHGARRLPQQGCHGHHHGRSGPLRHRRRDQPHGACREVLQHVPREDLRSTCSANVQPGQHSAALRGG